MAAGSASSFFKVLMSDVARQMRIPPEYVKNLDKRSLGKCTIRGPSGRCWTVEVDQRENNFYFAGGWQDFAKYHRLEVGDFLVFDYDGKSNFRAKIYCRSSSKEDAGLSENNNDKLVSLVEKKIYLEPKVEVDELESEIYKEKCKKKITDSNIVACDHGLSRKKPCSGKKVEGYYLEPKVEVDELVPEINKEQCKRKVIDELVPENNKEQCKRKVIDSNITASECGLSRKKSHAGKKVEGNYLEPKVEVDELEPEIHKENIKKKVIDSNIIDRDCGLSREKPNIGQKVGRNCLQQKVQADEIERVVYKEKCKKKVTNSNKVDRNCDSARKKPCANEKVEGNHLQPQVEDEELQPEIYKKYSKKKVMNSKKVALDCAFSRKKPCTGKKLEENLLQPKVEAEEIEPEIYKENSKKKVMNDKVARDCVSSEKIPRADDEQKPPIFPFSLKSKNSCFVATWKKHRLYRMSIPMKIAREKGLLNKKSAVLQDVFGRSWPVKLVIDSDLHLIMTSGFADFCYANEVKNGNTLLFEFVKPRVMKVYISRAEVHVSGARKGRNRIEVL
ncbi:hypothetical protein FEM48_Zijuj06G0073000 [Ziziphus jujuba var. spinosa]|uniref:TF-B3 domain-containing protein n=1 Tax=Ziziphus jujuba var. spinosa TaxID=714518 RepID=A0A978V7X6_ZIZJJ|nr:hypothetical protein FEM48_Zijuj06G0073000 [Ziziphus jujuba var. spinosa]